MGWFGDHYLYWNIDDKRIIRIRMNATFILTTSARLYLGTYPYKTFEDWIERYMSNLSFIEDNSVGFG